MAQSYNTNLYNVAKHYLQILKIPVTKTTLKETLEHNPYYPSLYSISNVFNRLGIPNEAFTLDEENFNQLESPFITYCSGQSTGKDFVLVTKITSTHVTYFAEKNTPKIINKEQFIKQWHKTVFVAEANVQSGEKNFAIKRKNENAKSIKQGMLYAVVVLLLSSMIYLFINNIGSAGIMIGLSIVFIKLLGISVTVLLLIYEIDKSNTLVKNICTAGKQINCGAVLNSKGGKILGMSWGEVGFFYFASTTLFLLFSGLSFVNKIPLLAIASTLVAPYMVFSIYYQWKVVKQWCPLCLTVQAVLAMELIWSIVNFWIESPFQSLLKSLEISYLWVWVCGVVILPIVIWYLLKPVLINAKEAISYKASYNRLLYHPEIFYGLLQQQTSAPDGWQKLGINIGHADAKNTIIKVCNPYCTPCAKAHSVLEEIVTHNKDIKVKIIFSTTNSETNRATKPVKHLLAIAAKGDLVLTKEAVDEWYMAKDKDYDIFAAKYPMGSKLEEQGSKIDKMKNWCDEAEITGTPTIFINGKRLPDTYRIDELKNLF